MTSPILTFHDGNAMPQLGFGLWQVPEDSTGDVVATALDVGYRLADGAAIYGNEAGLGEGLRKAGLPRADVFVTTKVWNARHGFDETLHAVEESLNRIGIDHLDLCLIHWPCPDENLYVDTWKALIRLRGEGRIRSIGVSNFNEEHLDRIIGETGEVPVLNQIELHPRLQQAHLRKVHADRGIITQSWTPLGNGKSFDDPAVTAIARRLGATPVQVILAWHLALGLSVIPRSTKRAHLADNLGALDITLTGDDLAAIAGLDAGDRLGPDPLTFS